MYAVICSPKYFDIINQIISSKEEEIFFKVIDNKIDINTEFNKMKMISIKHLIIDITTICNDDNFINRLIQYKITNDNTQIIIIAPGYIPGDKLIYKLVTKVHIYDVVTNDFGNKIKECIECPSTYKKCTKWIIENDITETTKKKKVKEFEKIVIKKQLVGKVVIGLIGTHAKVGTTHLGILLVNFLRRKGFSVAFLQLNNSNDVEKFLKSYDDVLSKDGYYSLRSVDYYLYNDDFNINIPYKRNYDFFVLDAGVYNTKNKLLDEYERAIIKGVITTAREWEISYLENFLSKTENNYQYDFLFNFADEELFKYIRSNMNTENIHYKMFKMNMESDLIDGVGLDEVYEEWLKRFVFDQSKNNKKQSFFSKFLKNK